MSVRGRPEITEESATALERRVASMVACGANETAIAMLLEISDTSVKRILARPRVARLALALTGFISEDIAPAVRNLSKAIDNTAVEAFDIEKRNMRELDQLGQELEEPKHQIRAKLGAVATAQDILDRAGKRAPTKVEHSGDTGNLPPEAVNNLVSVVKELVESGNRTIDISPTR